MKNKMQIMQEIKEYRSEQLIEAGDNRVFYTTIQALDKGENTGKQVYRIIEEYSIGENQSEIRELFYEYENEPVLIAQRNPEIMNKINPELAESIISVNKIYDDKDWELIVDDIETGIEKNQEKMEKQALKLGLDEEEIKGLSEIDIDKKIRDKIENNNKDISAKNEKNYENREEEPESSKEDKAMNISEEQAERCGIIGINTLNLEQVVGVQNETLRKQIGFDKPEFADIEKLVVIPTYKLKYLKEFDGRIPDVPFVVVGQKENGQGLKVFQESVAHIYKGENNEITTIGEENIKREKPDSIIEFPHTNASISLKQTSPYGIVDATLDYKDRDNSDRMSLELKNENRQGKEKINTEVQEIVGTHNGREYVDDALDEVNSHPKSEIDNGELERVDADGKEDTVSHIHNVKETECFKEAVKRIMDEAKLYNEEPIIEELCNKIGNLENGDFKGNLADLEEELEEATDEIIEDQNEQYRGKTGERKSF